MQTATSTLSEPRARIGAIWQPETGCSVRVWAPFGEQVAVEVYGPAPRRIQLESEAGGYWAAVVPSLKPGSRYKYDLGRGRTFPDPASRSQPDGVHEPSEVVSDSFEWSDQKWHGIPVESYIIYEVHIGTFTREGTFDSAIEHLPYLKDLGVTAVEVMPVAQFPGARNWGYDGVYPFAVQSSYGGPAGFKRFVDAAHATGLAVILDVVYNHLGPEGNYLGQFGPYFTDRYQTPWGQAINFDGPDSAAVRDYFIQNALNWVTDYHIDGLRLDAVHAIHDSSSRHILTDIAEALHDFAQDHERIINVIAESDLNEERIVRSGDVGGYGLDAQWSDDFHHAVHAVLTGENAGYYEDFGSVEDVAKALSEGFVYSGQYSKHRGRCHGTECTQVPGRAFVVCVQNHDQIGNRMLGERLSHLVPFDDLKLAAGVLLLAPYVPLLFMGQEYGEQAPFLYFVSHSDPQLVEAVREGRRREFASFAWRGELPDAQHQTTFERSKLNHQFRESGQHAALLKWYQRLLRLRSELPPLATLNRQAAAVDIVGSGQTITLRRWDGGEELLAIFHLAATGETVAIPVQQRGWEVLLDSAAQDFAGGGSTIPDVVTATSEGLQLELRGRHCVLLRNRS